MKESGVILTRLGGEVEKNTIFCPSCGEENISRRKPEDLLR